MKKRWARQNNSLLTRCKPCEFVFLACSRRRRQSVLEVKIVSRRCVFRGGLFRARLLCPKGIPDPHEDTNCVESQEGGAQVCEHWFDHLISYKNLVWKKKDVGDSQKQGRKNHTLFVVTGQRRPFKDSELVA